MATALAAPRRKLRRLVVRIPVTCGADLSFGIALRTPRKRRRRRRALATSWATAISRSALLVLNLVVPIAIVLGANDLGKVGVFLTPAARPVLSVSDVASLAARPVLHARRTLVTVTSPDPPQVRTHVVGPSETLLSIAADYGVTPQTIAYDNGISDSGALRVGASLLIPPFDAAIHVLAPGETIDEVASRFGVDPDTVRVLNRVGADDVVADRPLLLPVPDARYPNFRLRLSDPPRVLAPRVRWPAEGLITQLFSPAHTGVDIAAPYGRPIVASDAGTVSFVGWRGPGGLAVCVYQDWGLETCAYHASAAYVEVGERVLPGQRIAAIGTTGVTSGPHVHWEARTNGALVDPLTYAATVRAPVVGGATGSP